MQVCYNANEVEQLTFEISLEILGAISDYKGHHIVSIHSYLINMLEKYIHVAFVIGQSFTKQRKL